MTSSRLVKLKGNGTLPRNEKVPLFYCFIVFVGLGSNFHIEKSAECFLRILFWTELERALSCCSPGEHLNWNHSRIFVCSGKNSQIETSKFPLRKVQQTIDIKESFERDL